MVKQAIDALQTDAAAAPLAGADALATWTSLFVLIDTHLVLTTDVPGEEALQVPVYAHVAPIP